MHQTSRQNDEVPARDVRSDQARRECEASDRLDRSLAEPLQDLSGKVSGAPTGQYLRRPLAAAA